MGMYTFDGVAGEAWSLYAAASGGWAGSITVRKPGGSTLPSATLTTSSPQRKLDLGVLPTSGTYQVEVAPTDLNCGAVELRLLSEVRQRIELDGPAGTIAIPTGANGRFVFDAGAGEVPSFALTTLGTSPPDATVTLTVLRPDGSTLSTHTTSRTMAVPELPPFPATGTYAIKVAPAATAGANATVLVSRRLTGALEPGGGPTRHDGSRPGVSGRYTFQGDAGQGWTVLVVGGGGYASTLRLQRPDGSLPASATTTAGAPERKIATGLVSAAGTYELKVTPTELSVGTLDMTVIPEARGELVIGGAPLDVALSKGQNGRYTFLGSAGDLITLSVPLIATAPAGQNVTFKIISPSGAQLMSNYSSAGRDFTVTGALPLSGPYSVEMSPAGVSAANLRVAIKRR
jgi:hypothetical protein